MSLDGNIDERLGCRQFPIPLIRQMNQSASVWAINLWLWQLGKWFSLAPEILEQMKDVLQIVEWWNKSIFDYWPNAWTLDFRRAIANNQSNKDGNKYTESNVVSTIWVQWAMYTALWTLSQLWAKRVLIPEVNFGIYRKIPENLGMEVCTYKLTDNHGIDINYLSYIIKQGDIVILNPVANPTWRVLSSIEMQDIWQLLEEKLPNGYVISDEIYDALVYDNEVQSWSFSKYFERTIVCNGVSKSGAMAWLRSGWIVSQNMKLIEAMTSFQTTQLSSPAPFNQVLSIPIVTGKTQETIDSYNQTLLENRDIALKILDKMELSYVKPQWSFYIFPTIRDTIEDVKEACMKVAWNQNWVVIIPWQAFWAKRNVRISLACPTDTFWEWMSRFETLFS